MPNNITFSPDAWADYLYWQSEDRKTLRRINSLLQELQREGAIQGIRKAERLRNIKAMSKRIDKTNRLVYVAQDEAVMSFRAVDITKIKSRAPYRGLCFSRWQKRLPSVHSVERKYGKTVSFVVTPPTGSYSYKFRKKPFTMALKISRRILVTSVVS